MEKWFRAIPHPCRHWLHLPFHFVFNQTDSNLTDLVAWDLPRESLTTPEFEVEHGHPASVQALVAPAVSLHSNQPGGIRICVILKPVFLVHRRL